MSYSDTPLPVTVDVNVPSVARMYDFLLGGKDSHPVDQDACAALLEEVPSPERA
ncbi:SAM-dependent methyltransferase [Streptomyces sp. RKAG337]|uniref:SAM-dependent methyltransferase n=1 Tax=Streptomyces sp. RKAG337 TaxID=2893404 RepID=UPI0027E49CC2|nr:SAM-dependent methyltransferase [Streptomyces sp. RKAG337]